MYSTKEIVGEVFDTIAIERKGKFGSISRGKGGRIRIATFNESSIVVDDKRDFKL
jgi:hypothetical protein